MGEDGVVHVLEEEGDVAEGVEGYAVWSVGVVLGVFEFGVNSILAVVQYAVVRD